MTEVKLNGSIDLSIPVKKVNPARKQVKKEPRVSMPRVRSVDEIKQSVTTALEKVGGKYVHFDDINHTEGLLVAGVIDSIDGDDDEEDEDCATCKANRICPLHQAIEYRKENHIHKPGRKNRKPKKHDEQCS